MIEKLPVYVNLFPDGHATLTCAHCAVDAQLEGGVPTALHTERRDDPPPAGTVALLWQSGLTPEQVLLAARDYCMHLKEYGQQV
jgi:hypothetical protein